MSRILPSAVLAVLLGAGLAGSPAQAANEGQEDLDKATELKLSVKTRTDLGEVIRLCESALKKGLDKENTEFANKLLAATLIQRGTLDSKTTFESLRDGDSAWVRYRRSALDDLERAVKLDDQQAEAFLRIAQLNLLPGGNPKRAAEALDRSIAVNKEEPQLKAQALVMRAGMQKDPAKRLADLAAAVQAAPGDPSALRGRGMAYLQQEKYKEALADFEAALKLDPRHVPTLEAKATALGRLKRYDEALKTLDAARKLEPDSVSPLIERARISMMRDDFPTALNDLNEADRMEPGNIAVLLLRANVYQELDDDAKAMADVDRALRLRPGLDLAMRFRAALLAAQGNYAEAIAQLEELLKSDPDDTEARTQLAMLYSMDRKHPKAIEILTAVLKKDPKNWSALRNRGDVLLGIGKHAEAIADYEQALRLKPDDPGILNNFAWVLATSPVDGLRNGKRAIELAERACKVTDYKQAHILSTLGAAYAETGDFETAKKWSQKAIELGRDDQKDALKKEMESYKAKKPVRELKTGNEPEDQPKPRKKAKPKAERKGKDAPKAVPDDAV